LIAPYNMAGLEDLAGNSNIGAVIERIDHAATRACVLFRATGQTLTRGRMASADDFDDMLRELVARAADECFQAQDVAKESQAKQPMLIESVQGVADNEIFRVVVDIDNNGHITADILMRLV
jgi:hypothetical protein